MGVATYSELSVYKIFYNTTLNFGVMTRVLFYLYVGYRFFFMYILREMSIIGNYE